eukprot:11122497-Lingulodinium_polyedra.AAC.1
MHNNPLAENRAETIGGPGLHRAATPNATGRGGRGSGNGPRNNTASTAGGRYKRRARGRGAA